ncbi:unnamed protein product, partial [marine sediment metagenome]
MDKPPEVDTIMPRVASSSKDRQDASNSQDTQSGKKPFHCWLPFTPVYTAREGLTNWIRYCIIILERLKLVKEDKAIIDFGEGGEDRILEST